MNLHQRLEDALRQAVEQGDYSDMASAKAAARSWMSAGATAGDSSFHHHWIDGDAGPMLAALLRSTKCFFIVVTDLPGNVVAWNEGATRILGWTFEEMEGRSADIFFTPEDRARGVPHDEMLLALEQGSALDERWHVRKNGTRFWGSGFMMPLLDEGNRAIGFIKVAQERPSASFEA